MNAPAARLDVAPAAEARLQTFAFVALLAGGVSIAFAPIFVRLSDTGPIASAFWRTALAVPGLWLWVWLEARGRGAACPERVPAPAWPMLVAGLCFAGDLAIWHISILYTSVANSTLLANFAPIWVTLGAWLLFRQRVTKLFLIGMAVSLAGALVLVGPSFSASGKQLLGDALAMLTAIFYAGYFLAVKSLRDRHSTARVMAWSTTLTAIVLFPVALASGNTLLPSSAQGWLVLLGLALICQIMGQGLIAYAMAHLPAAFSALSLLVQPVLATAYAWIILAEPAGWAQWAGGLVVLIGIYLARRGS